MIILTIDSESNSASKLGYPTFQFWSRHNESCDTVLRWGNSELCLETAGPITEVGKCLEPQEFQNVINPAKAIRLNCNKLKALRKLATVVDTPKIYTRNVPTRKTVLVRPNSHANGSSFKIVHGPGTILPGHYGTAWIRTDLEYRVWFVGEATLCARRVSKRKPERYPCRSSWGYRWKARTPDRLVKDTLAAAKAIGLTTGAADVLVKDGRYIFLELNSAPSIDHNRIIEFYVLELGRMVGNVAVQRQPDSAGLSLQAV